MGFLFGENKLDIDKKYEDAVANARNAVRRASLTDAYNKAFINQSKNNEEIARKSGIDVDAIRKNNWDEYTDAEGNKQSYTQYLKDLQKERSAAWDKNKYNVFGNGMVGAVLHPLIQVSDIAGDMLSSPFRALAGEETNRYLRDTGNDFVSDIGAIGETAFDMAGMGALGNAVKGGTKLTANLGKTALRTGLLGAGENAFGTIREEGRDTNAGDVLLSAGLGGAIGGGIGALSQLGGNAANIAKQVRSPQMRTLNEYYQNALAGNSAPLNPTRMLGDGVGGASVGTAGNYLDWVPKEAKAAMERSGTPLAKTGIGRVFQGFGDSNAIYGNPLAPIMNSKVGQTTRNILKTPAGKVGAGLGGGLLLSNLLKGGGNNQAQAGNDLSNLSDEQLLQLLNYYNNGGY